MRKSSTMVVKSCALLLACLMPLGFLLGFWRLTAWAQPEAAANQSDDLTSTTSIAADSGPLLIQNVGQYDAQGRFLLRHGRGQTWLTQDAILLQVIDGLPSSEANDSHLARSRAREKVTATNLRISFVGANPRPGIEPAYPGQGKINYLLGNDPAGWVTHVPVWSQIRYVDLYPGVDLIIGNSSRALPATAGPLDPLLPWYLEADASADLSQIRLRIEGADELAVEARSIILGTKTGSLALSLPAVIGVDGQIRDFKSAARVQLIGQPDVAASVGGIYELAFPFAPLIADSDLAAQDTSNQELFYSTYLGGSSGDWALGVDIDTTGSAYIVGSTPSTDFPTVIGSYSTTLQAQDAFVAKLNADGTDLVYATFLGGASTDSGYDIQVVDGRAFVTGETSSSNFPTTDGAYDESCGTDDLCNLMTDAFLAQLNADGSDLLYATYIGGEDSELGRALRVSAGRVMAVGTTWSQEFPTTFGAYDRSCGSDGRCDPFQGDPLSDGYLVELNPAGNGSNDLIYGTYLGGSDEDNANDVDISGGDAYITGDSASFDFPANGYSGNDDAFVARIDPAGDGAADLAYGTFLGGSGTDRGRGIAVSGAIAHVTGDTRSSNFPVSTGTYNGGFNDAFIAQLDGNGIVNYAAFLGGDGEDGGRTVALDETGAMVVAGYTSSLSDTFPVTAGAFDASHNGKRDSFVARIWLESTAPQYIAYASYLGGSQDDEVYGLAVDDLGRGYLIGYTMSPTDYPTVTGSFQTVYNGGFRDGFVTKMQVGAVPGLRLKKYINGLEAQEPPGPYYDVGAPITWTYEVENIGLDLVSDVTIEDDHFGLVCPAQDLAPGETMACEIHDTVAPGQYVNLATAAGDPPPEFERVSDTALGHYFGAMPQVELQKRTNERNADVAPGPFIAVGDSVTWTYLVTNTGNVQLSNIVVTDSLEGPASCDYTTLERNQRARCVITATNGAIAGPYTNTGYVNASPPGGLADVRSADESHYFGVDGLLLAKKLTNGQQANQPPGPYVLAGAPVTWTYVITNASNVALDNLVLWDDQLGSIDCVEQLDIWQSASCQEVGQATAGQYSNQLIVSGVAPGAIEVTTTAVSYYYGVQPDVTIEKFTNGVNADAGTGPLIPEGDLVSWTYVVTNTGNITLTEVAVTDSDDVFVECEGVPALGAGRALTCSGEGIAVKGQYVNVGTVTAMPLVGSQVSDSDPSRYFGSSPALAIVKMTNGQEAAFAPGPYLIHSDPVSWTYLITNTGNVSLSGLALADDQIGPISCPLSDLDPQQGMLCEHEGLAIAGLYSNTGVITGSPPVGENVTATAISHYFGVDAAVDLLKLINGQLVEGPPGPNVLAGQPVSWTFIISNTGNATLSHLSLVDDRLGPIDCPQDGLMANASMTCQASASAAAGAISNTATVSGQPPAGDPVKAQASSHYFGVVPNIRIEKLTNGVDADSAPGVIVDEGDLVTWTYIVSNTGNITLTSIIVVDSEGVEVDCPDAVLGIEQSFACSASGQAIRGQYSNTGLVTAVPAYGPEVSASDSSHYFGSSPGLAIHKLTNGQQADQAPGPYILANDLVTWTYVMTNTGNITLTEIAVVDDRVGPIECPQSQLAPGAMMRCEAAGLAVAGQYHNTVTVTGYPPEGAPSTAGAVSHYFGANPALQLEKKTSGTIVDGYTIPFIPEGNEVQWTYVVTNTGNVVLDDVEVWDDNGTNEDLSDDTLVCVIDTLAVGATSDPCAMRGEAVAGPYTNRAWAYGTPPGGLDQIMGQDASDYFGTAPAISLQKSTNDHLADSPPGPRLIVGQSVVWSYLITNTGNITLTTVVVSDDNGTSAPGDDLVVCELNNLGPGHSVACQHYGTAALGQYANRAEARATPVIGVDVTASAISHYYGLRGVFLPMLIR